MHGIHLNYLLSKEDVGIYDTQWKGTEENIKQWIKLSSQSFREDNGNFYILFGAVYFHHRCRGKYYCPKQELQEWQEMLT